MNVCMRFDERKDTLNELFKYKEVECLTEDEYHFLNVFFQKSVERNIPIVEWREFVTIFNRVFHETKEACVTCGASNLNHIYTPLKKLFETYK